jgi:glycosyltransferase involved in cell wall biosynthesis
MRIAQISTLATPVGKECSGSVEGLVWLLTRELARLGHEVTVFAAAGSEADGNVVASLPGTYGRGGSPNHWEMCEWMNLCRAVERSGDYDVLHSHNYLLGVPLQPLAGAPMVHTTHIMPDDDALHILKIFNDTCVTAVSRYQWSEFPTVGIASVIHHGVDASEFTFNPRPGEYVCYLGRFSPEKGPLTAVTTARRLGLKVLLAGPPNDYFRKHVEPLVDGKSVEYVGSVTGVERSRLLGAAQALLYPITRPEPFGLVMIEAMMCGTPVAAMSLGAVPEIIDEGVTGYYAGSTEGFERSVLRAVGLDRKLVRRRAMARFSSARMAADYLRVYERVGA